MSMDTGEPTVETNYTNDVADGSDNYVPAFSAAERKVAYLISGLAGILGGVMAVVSATPGVPAWMAVLGGALGIIGSGVAGLFGVHYVGVSK